MRIHRAKTTIPLWLLAALAAATAAHAAEPSGKTVAVVQAADASGGAGRRVLAVNGPVYMGDTIRTGSGGEAQIELADNTRLVVGPNSSLVVDAFVFDGSGRAKDVTLNAVRGAFRFITGSSRKSAYTINTPTATIGVRGTEFDFSVDGGGKVDFALYSGVARICGRNGRCTELSGACSVAIIPQSGAVNRLPAGTERTRLLQTQFPYIARQTRLNRAFRVDTSSCSVRRADILPGAPASPLFAATPPAGVTVDPVTTGTIRNRNGFADNTNPGLGSFNNNSPGGGSSNPGGGGTGGGGNGNGNGGNGNGNGNGRGHDG